MKGAFKTQISDVDEKSSFYPAVRQVRMCKNASKSISPQMKDLYEELRKVRLNLEIILCCLLKLSLETAHHFYFKFLSP